MVLDAPFLNTQHYKVWVKSKMEQSRERSSALSLHLGVEAIEKEAFGSPSTMVANFTFLYPNCFFFSELSEQLYLSICEPNKTIEW